MMSAYIANLLVFGQTRRCCCGQSFSNWPASTVCGRRHVR